MILPVDGQESSNPVSQDRPHPEPKRPLPSPERIQSLLFDACRIGRDDVIPALLQAGADIEARNEKGHTALILASYNGNVTTTSLLLEQGAAVDTPDFARGNTALMGVAFKGHDAIARILVTGGADVDRRNGAGQTALMNAAMFGHIAIVDLLLDHGASPSAVDVAGNSAASLADVQGNTSIAERLRKVCLSYRSSRNLS